MMPSVWLETIDGAVHEVDLLIISLSPILHKKVTVDKEGTRTSAIILPSLVDSSCIESINQYCLFHLTPGQFEEGLNDGVRKKFDQNFLKLHESKLNELLFAARWLEIIPLTELLNGKDIIYRNVTMRDFEKTRRSDLKARLRGWQVEKAIFCVVVGDRDRQKSSVAGEQKDDRPIESPESYINSGGEHEKATRREKSKKKKKKKKDAKASSVAEGREKTTQCVESKGDDLDLSSAKSLRDGQEHEIFGRSEVAPDGELLYEDDYPEIKIEVEEFQRRLNLSWKSWKQEILGSGKAF